MQTLTQTQFKLLTKTEQVVSVLKNGKQCGQRSLNEYSVKLFLLGEFYVELWYAAGGREIEKVKPLSIRTVKKLYGMLPRA